MQDSWYHAGLRVASVTLAMLLVFVSGLALPHTAELSRYSATYLANVVGVGASVAPNDLNVITAQLTARERELDERELLLTQREMATGVDRDGLALGSDQATYILSTILFILLILIILNYALDFRRSYYLESGRPRRSPVTYAPRHHFKN